MTIKVVPWYELPSMKGVARAINQLLPGWKIDGPYCPGKAWHDTFRATLGDQVKMVFVHIETKTITIEG